MNWTAAWHLMQKAALPSPPCTVTADYSVTLKRPTPIAHPVRLRARVVESQADRAVVEATLEAASAEGPMKVCATGRGTFVAVKPGHPAYHRW
jgi:acyl-coenzyme A thioesterase PaaI-like protein